MNVVGQLYQFVRMGFQGYKEVNEHMLNTSKARARRARLNLRTHWQSARGRTRLSCSRARACACRRP